MRPILFHIGQTPVWSHTVFVGLGLLLALLVSWHITTQRGRASRAMIVIISGGLVGAALFAKFGLVVRYALEAAQPTLSGFLREGGRTLLGGLAGAYLGVILAKRSIGYRAHTGDLLAPGVALGIAVGRIGCFLAEAPGTATSMPWGVRVPPEIAITLANCTACTTGAAMHPSFLYESAFMLVAAWWLYPHARRGTMPAQWMQEGDLFKLFLLTYAVFRFVVEFTRENFVIAFGLSGSQLTVLAAMLWLSVTFIRRTSRTPQLNTKLT